MKPKKIALFLSIAAILAVVAVFFLNYLAERKITNFLDNEFDAGQLDYGAVETNVLFGNVEIDSIVFSQKGLEIDLKKLEVSGVHYLDFLWNDKLVVNKIYLNSPRISVRKHPKDSTKKKNPQRALKKTILAKTIEIENGKAIFFKNEKDTLLSVENFSAKVDSVSVTSNTLRQNIPFEHKKHTIKTESVFFDLNKYHEITVEKIEVSDKRVLLENLLLRPKYSRSEFRSVIPYEKDMFNLKIVSWKIEQPFFDFFAEKPVFKSPLMFIEGADFKAYRDKTVADDPRTKKMYSEMLRELPFRIDIEKTRIRNAFIQYQERIEKDRQLGRVAFYKLNAEVLDLTNLNLDSENFPTTKLSIDTRFMNTSDLHVDWHMDVSSDRDYFTISGEAKHIPPEAMNPFFVPAMHVKAKGGIDAVYFNFSGDYIDALGDMKMNYSDFSVEVLKKKGEEKNKFLSVIANIFVKANPKNGTVSKEDIHVVRDATKSFWNYFWSCIEKGLLKLVL
ncbi:MAG TPA: hypothetical protein VFM65_02395 [Flavobacteriaceae bacterium]|nr:hypothetical protein [Flavobacteriaceae bacterium]